MNNENKDTMETTKTNDISQDSIPKTSKNPNLLASFGGFILGLGLAIILAIIFIYIMYIIDSYVHDEITAYPVFYIGAFQLLYIIPIILLLIRKKQHNMMPGVITGALVIVLLNILFLGLVEPNLTFGW